METAQRRQTISKLSRIPNYSGGGLIDGLKRVVGLAPKQPPAAPSKQPPTGETAKISPGGVHPAMPAPMGNQTIIDKRMAAAGAAQGAKIKPGMAKEAMSGTGGMLKGPGTSTSDDIPAQVVDTGEPIRVATGERIVSKKQDKFLQEVAKERGFGSVDAMFEDATGIPVGPTLKYADDGKAGSAEPMQHASLGGMFDSLKQAVGIKPDSPELAAYKAEAAAKREAAKKPAATPVTGASAGLDGTGGNSMTRREKEAGLASGGRVAKNMARQRLGDMPTMTKKKSPVSDRSGEQELAFAEGGVMGAIYPGPSFGLKKNPAAQQQGQTEEERARARAEASANQDKAEARAERSRFEAREDMHREQDRNTTLKLRGFKGYAGGGVVDEDAVDRINALASKVQESGETLPSLAQIGAASAPRNVANAAPTTQADLVSQIPIGGVPIPKAGPVATESGAAPAPAAPATIPAGPNAAARMRGLDGQDVGNGVQRFNTAGKSPLFTNMTDAAGMASNERLNNCGPVTAENQTAMQGIQGRQDAADSGRARMAQYNAEVAGAKAINDGQEAMQLQRLALQGNRGAQAILAGNKTDATTRRGQDVQREGDRLSADASRYTADSNAGVQRGRNANEQEKQMREDRKANAELKQKARIDQLDNLIINGNPMQQKLAANQKAALMGKGMDSGDGKPLAGPVLKQLQEARDNSATISNLSQSFKDDFAGKGVFGIGADASMNMKATLGVDKDAVEWWKNYKKQSELVERHALFGASLTPGEQDSWRSADIGPGMDKDVIKKNLATRAALQKRVFENTRQDLIDAGNSDSRINAIASRGAPDAPPNPQTDPGGQTQAAPANQPAATTPQPTQVKTKAERDALPKGALYIAPDGVIKRK